MKIEISRRLADPDDWIISKDGLTLIVHPDLYEKAQEILGERQVEHTK